MSLIQKPVNGVEKTIGESLNEIAARYPHNTAIVHCEHDIRWTYCVFLSQVNRAARGLMRIGIERGDKVALWAPNIPEWIISQMAVAKVGAVLVPVDVGAGTKDLRYMLVNSGCRSLIMTGGQQDDDCAGILSELIHDSLLESIIVIDEKPDPQRISWSRLMEISEEVDRDTLTEREREVKPTDPVAIMYTSGTTGKPKGVVLNHRGLITKSTVSAKRQGLNNQDRLCLFFPLFHMFGNTCIALTGFLAGASIIIPSQTFEPTKILSAIYGEGCTALYGSPSMFITLIDHPEFRVENCKTLRKGIIGGAPCPMELMRKVVEYIGISDITVAYGITEASSWITMTLPEDPLDLRVSTIGTALECNEVKIIDPITGEDLPAGHPGELCTRGFLMIGYYAMPAATAAAIDQEGWFHAGDLGEMDEAGYIKITGRIKDVIVRDGIEIYPTELEETIYQLPGVSEVQVFGFPHPTKGQEVAAWIKPSERADLSLDVVARFVADHVDKEKAPQYYKLVTGFPITRTGKVQKFRLAELAAKEYREK
jgi:fatty-acyl-CoA synthase